MKMRGEVPEGFGGEDAGWRVPVQIYFVGFGRVLVQMPCENSKGIRCFLWIST